MDGLTRPCYAGSAYEVGTTEMGSRAACFALTVLAAWVCTNAVASAEELVRFESTPFRVSEIQQRLARERGETPRAAPDTIEGYLSKPEGDGPFAAIVYLHGCAGLSENVRKNMARLMTGWGYVSLAVDSFAPRGIQDQCTHLAPTRLGDALAALSYLSRLPLVDPQRIAVVGSSQGAIVALKLASTYEDIFDAPRDLRFIAAVAYYPMCGAMTEDLVLPALILIGELDDWTPARDCELWTKWQVNKGAPGKLVVYPGAYHAFDVSALADGRERFGHWLKYDAAAAAGSVQEMQSFLASQFFRERR
jgi:dienelactone hydrolase